MERGCGEFEQCSPIVSMIEALTRVNSLDENSVLSLKVLGHVPKLVKVHYIISEAQHAYLIVCYARVEWVD